MLNPARRRTRRGRGSDRGCRVIAKMRSRSAGHWHIDIIDNSGATSCYDTDAGDRNVLSHIPPIAVAIDCTHL